jgi:hypothetical protein
MYIMTKKLVNQIFHQDHSIISTPDLSDVSSSGSPAQSDLISLQGRPDLLHEMWSNPPDFDPLEYEPLLTDWPLLYEKFTPSNDGNWADTPITGSRSDSEPLQNRNNSIISPDSVTNLMVGSSPAKGQGNPKDKKHKSPPLSCPFYRANPLKYYKCQKYDLQRIKDVKQHIHRKHVKPDFYCARCYEVFGDAASRDSHIREGTCDIRWDY